MRPNFMSFGLLALCISYIAALFFAPQPGSDLLATWLAAAFFDAGQVAVIYPADTHVFTLTPPSEWAAVAVQLGHEGPVFPYIYPPLWAALLAPVTQVISFDMFQFIMVWTYGLLIFAMVWLAARMARDLVPIGWGALAGSGIALTSLGYWVAMIEGQPQVIVSFLIVLAFERRQAGHSGVAGAALALAAAIKVFPVLFALVWIGARDWRALGSFAGVGLALGLGSIAVAGWPLHQAFLEQLSVIQGSVILSHLNISLQSALAAMQIGPGFEPISLMAVGDGAGMAFWAVQKPLWVNVLSSAATLIAVLGLSTAVWRNAALDRDPLFWVFVAMVFSFLAPLAWVYHFLHCLVFWPLLFARLGRVGRWAVFVPAILALSWPLRSPLDAVFNGVPGVIYLGALAICALLGCLAVAVFTKKRL